MVMFALCKTFRGPAHHFSRNIKDQSSFFPPISINALLPSPNYSITSASVRPNGTPIVNCSNGVVHSYDPALLTWVKLSEKWWARGSDVWQGRQRGKPQDAARNIMSSIEGSVGGSPGESLPDKQRPTWWNAALTLGHLETRLNSTRLLDSPNEYKLALLMYAKRISDEGFRAKGEELIKELFGPVYWCVAVLLCSWIGC